MNYIKLFLIFNKLTKLYILLYILLIQRSDYMLFIFLLMKMQYYEKDIALPMRSFKKAHIWFPLSSTTRDTYRRLLNLLNKFSRDIL